MRAAEQDRPDVAREDKRWRLWQRVLEPDAFVFIDETGASTKHGPALRLGAEG